jgi:hypothetical protein
MDDLSGKSAHLTVGNIIKLVQADPCFPEHRRVGVLSSLRCVVRWLGKGADRRRNRSHVPRLGAERPRYFAETASQRAK